MFIKVLKSYILLIMIIKDSKFHSTMWYIVIILIVESDTFINIRVHS